MAHSQAQWKVTYWAHFRGTHHVPEMGAQSSCRLVVLHHTVVVQDFSTAFTVAEVKQSLASFRIMKAFNFTHWVQCHNYIIPSINLMGKQAEGQWWGRAEEGSALHSLDCSSLPAWLTCRLGGVSAWGGCGSTPQIPKHWSRFSYVSVVKFGKHASTELESCPKPGFFIF